MTDVPGVMRDKNDIATKFTSLSISSVRELVADGTIAGGMIPKYALDQQRCSDTPERGHKWRAMTL